MKVRVHCRTCRYLEVPPDRDAVVRPRKGHCYPCRAPIPTPVLPDSVTRSYHWRWPPVPNHMAPEDGAACPLWEAWPDYDRPGC